MLPGMELMGCQDLAVPNEVMHHVVGVESAFNPYAIGVVGGRLERQPRNAAEALATAHDLEARGYNFSLGLAQVNRHNLEKYGLSYEKAFESCPNLQAGARILAECHGRSGGDWGKSFSCYYSGNFVTGFRHGYVQKVFASMRRAASPVIGAETGSGDSRKSGRNAARKAPASVSGERSTPSLLPRPDAQTTTGPSERGTAVGPVRPDASAVPIPRTDAASEAGSADAAFVF